MMSWHIHAWLKDGKPCLEIVDADSGSVHLQWSGNDQPQGGRDVQQLFRELLLLSCQQDLRNGRLFSAQHR